MTRDDFIEELRKRRDQCGFTAGEEAYGVAMELAEKLDSPPAMTWQAPSCECMAYVQGCGEKILHVVKIGDHWCRSRPGKTYYAPVGDALICPIPAPPELPKRGDA